MSSSISSSNRTRNYPTGMGIYYESYSNKNKDGCVAFPCCADVVSKQWEKERTKCCEGDILSACCQGLGLRVSRGVVSAFDVAVGIVACPIICLGGTACSIGGCCVGGCETLVGHTFACCCGAEWERKVHDQGIDCLDNYLSLFVNSVKFSSLHALNAFNALARLPINLLVPEASELLLAQEECNVALNHQWKCVDYHFCTSQPVAQKPAAAQTPAGPPSVLSMGKPVESGVVD